VHAGRCHCGAIAVSLETPRPPEKQVLGQCQCSFCRKHNVRAFSDPGSRITLTAGDPGEVTFYAFGLRTAHQMLCRRCGVYVAMVLADGDERLSTLNIDTLDDRALFTDPGAPRQYDHETVPERIARRRARWTPTRLRNFPPLPKL
jgi:hypothetical protein